MCNCTMRHEIVQTIVIMAMVLAGVLLAKLGASYVQSHAGVPAGVYDAVEGWLDEPRMLLPVMRAMEDDIITVEEYAELCQARGDAYRPEDSVRLRRRLDHVIERAVLVTKEAEN